MMDVTDLSFSLISVVIAVFSIVFSYQRASKDDVQDVKKDAVEMEHRLTMLETKQFDVDDRKCLMDTAFKVGVLWTSVLRDFPSLLKQNSTPRFDDLLEKAKKDVHTLNQKEVRELIKFLDDEYEGAKESSTPGRGAIAAFYRAVFKSEIEGNVENGCK